MIGTLRNYNKKNETTPMTIQYKNKIHYYKNKKHLLENTKKATGNTNENTSKQNMTKY